MLEDFRANVLNQYLTRFLQSLSSLVSRERLGFCSQGASVLFLTCQSGTIVLVPLDG